MSKIILDLCGGTGSWSKPYKDAGYDVRLVTLPDFDVCSFDPPLNVYGILAAPPCTEFSIAKGGSKRDFILGMKTVEACMKIIWDCRIHGSLQFWALENPRGFLRQFLGKPPFEFQHWEFGTPQIKPTDLWGYFNFPKKKVLKKPKDLTIKYGGSSNARNWSSPKIPDEFRHLDLDRAGARAITPATFAKAFFQANK